MTTRSDSAAFPSRLKEEGKADDGFEGRAELSVHEGALKDQGLQIVGDVVVFEIGVVLLQYGPPGQVQWVLFVALDPMIQALPFFSPFRNGWQLVLCGNVIDEVKPRVGVRKRHDSGQQLREQNAVGITTLHPPPHTHMSTRLLYLLPFMISGAIHWIVPSMP